MLPKLSEWKRLITFLRSELSRQSKETGKPDSSPPGPSRPKDNKLGNKEQTCLGGMDSSFAQLAF